MPFVSKSPATFNLSRRLISIFLVSVLAIYLSGVAVTLRLRRRAITDLEADYTAQTVSFSLMLDSELTRIRTQMKYTLTRSVTLRMNLVPSGSSFPDLYESLLKVTEQIYALQNTSSLIEDTAIYFSGLNRCIAADGTYNRPTQTQEALLNAYRQLPAHSALLTADGELYLAADAANFADKSASAIVWVRLSRTVLSGWCAQYAQEGAASVLFYQGDSGMFSVCDPAAAEQAAVLLEDLQGAAGVEQEQAEHVVVGGADCLRVIAPASRWGIWAVSYVGADDLRAAAAPFLIWLVIPTAIVVLSIAVFLYLVWRLITRPFLRISGELRGLELTGAPQNSAPGSSDMDFLYAAFVELGERLKTTLEQSYSDKMLACQSEIKYLQAQISPHFLYNSFYHLYRMAKMEDNDGVAEMSMKLSSYYRYITRSAEAVVPLEMEVQNITDYTEIQTIRFGDRIAVRLAPLPPEYRTQPVPRFVLQPLFENAYNHGVEKMEQGVIQLRFVRRGRFLDILVENNGDCPDSELDALNLYLNDQSSQMECTALKNVRLRMLLAGGDLKVSHGALGGFGVRLSLPLQNDKGERKNDADIADCG